MALLAPGLAACSVATARRVCGGRAVVRRVPGQAGRQTVRGRATPEADRFGFAPVQTTLW
jgi:hypothetical protein